MIFQHLRTQTPNPRQQEFFEAEGVHIAYGGARAGGKSFAMRRKFVMLAMRYPGLKLILFRRTLPELRENHIIPLQAELAGYARYNSDARTFTFPNGSRLVMGYCDNESDAYSYHGQEYEVIGLEEATSFTEAQRNYLITIARTTRTDFKPRVYYTCNPGGPGHAWFKRLFVDREYTGAERPEDYVFIPASVYDNHVIMETNPEYVHTLEALPADMRRAHLMGDWTVFAGQYFTEFQTDIHVVKPFEIPRDWRRYVAIDYGLDMLAAYWIAVDQTGKAWVYREVYEPGLVVSAAAERLLAANQGEDIYAWLAPPDLWNKNRDTGRSTAEAWWELGLPVEKTGNDRVQGWYNLAEWLHPRPHGRAVAEGHDQARPHGRAVGEGHDQARQDEQGAMSAKLVFFYTCPNILRCLPQVQHDERDPNDVAARPHELTHGPDALRYFVAGRPAAPDGPRQIVARWEDDQWEDYYAADEAEQARMVTVWGNPFDR